MISHGASRFLQERLRDASDAYTTVYCKTCGTIANALALGDNYSCRLCRDKANFGAVTIPYVFKYLGHLLNGMGMFMNFKLATEDEYRNLQDIQEGREIPGEITAEEIEQIEQEEEERRQEEEAEGESDIFTEAQGEGFEGFEFTQGEIETENEYEE